MRELSVRRIASLSTVIVGLALSMSCQSPVLPAPGSAPGSGTNAANTIVVSFPGNSGKGITIATATNYSNFYQVLAYNASHIYYATVTSSGGTISNVANGTYTLIGLAGIKTSGSTNPIVVQLGGASQAGVVVGPTSPTVSLVLTNVLYSMTASPASATVNTPVTVTVNVDTGIPTVQPIIYSTAGSSWIPENATSQTATTLVSGSDWTASATFPGATAPGTTNYVLAQGPTGQLALFDAANGYSTATSLYSLTGGATNGVLWYMPTDYAGGYSPTYDSSIAPGSVNVTFTSPSINVGLSWGSGR